MSANKKVLFVLFIIGILAVSVYFVMPKAKEEEEEKGSKLKLLIENYEAGTGLKLEYSKIEKLPTSELEEFSEKLEKLSEKKAGKEGKLAGIYADTCKIELLRREYKNALNSLKADMKPCEKVSIYKKISNLSNKIESILSKRDGKILQFKKSYASVAEELNLEEKPVENFSKISETLNALVALLEVRCR